MIGSLIRRIGFYFLDFLKGSPVKKHVKDIENKMTNNGIANTPENILDYAIKNVPFYKNIKGNKLKDFPVIDKRIIMDNYDDFKSLEFLNSKVHTTKTSGSTGEPFKSIQDNNKRNRNISDLIYYHKNSGWNIGDKYVFLRSWTSMYSLSRMKMFSQNFIPLDVLNFNDTEKEKLRKALKKDKKIKVILGYASALDSLVSYLIDNNDDPSMFNIKLIITDSDELKPKTKKNLKKVFNCNIVDRYSNEEQGVLAIKYNENDFFTLNTASYYFEILKIENNNHAEKGEVGRLVVTDLFNKAMPFIRYDTGDLAVSDNDWNNGLTTIKTLQGRLSDVIYNTSGNHISSSLVNNYFYDMYDLKQYQLTQNSKTEYELKVVTDSEQYTESYLMERCNKFLGDNAIVKVKYVKYISPNKSGKFVTLKNNYQK